jgi:hypothetical protein
MPPGGTSRSSSSGAQGTKLKKPPPGTTAKFAFYCWDPSTTTTSREEQDQQACKVLYYAPSYAPPEEKVSQVSLTEGLIQFTRMFDHGNGHYAGEEDDWEEEAEESEEDNNGEGNDSNEDGNEDGNGIYGNEGEEGESLREGEGGEKSSMKAGEKLLLENGSDSSDSDSDSDSDRDSSLSTSGSDSDSSSSSSSLSDDSDFSTSSSEDSENGYSGGKNRKKKLATAKGNSAGCLSDLSFESDGSFSSQDEGQVQEGKRKKQLLQRWKKKKQRERKKGVNNANRKAAAGGLNAEQRLKTQAKAEKDLKKAQKSLKNAAKKKRSVTGESEPLHTIRTKMYSIGVREVEPDIWFCLCVKNPERKKRYLEDCIPENTLKALILNLYRVFRLLQGPVRKYMAEYGRQKLVEVFEDFVPAYVETIQYNLLMHQGSVLHNGIFYELEGFQYAPVERHTYMQISSFLRSLQGEFCYRKKKEVRMSSNGLRLAGLEEVMGANNQNPNNQILTATKSTINSKIKYVSLFYEAHLIYSGLPLQDMQILYSYLVNTYNGQVKPGKLNHAPYGEGK